MSLRDEIGYYWFRVRLWFLGAGWDRDYRGRWQTVLALRAAERKYRQ